MKPVTKKRLTKKVTKKNVWIIFSQYIRLKYADANGNDTCYTCGVKKPWREMQTGHAIGGRTNSILFDEEIVRPQCVRCNIFLGGNYTEFVTKLIKEKGMKWWDKKLLDSKTVKKFNKSDLQNLYEHYKSEIEKLEVKDE